MKIESRNVVPVAMAQQPVTSLDIGRRIVALVHDDITAAALRAGLAPIGDDFELVRGNISSAIRIFEKAIPPQAMIVDISGVENPLAALDDLARVCPPDVRVFVIGEDTDINFYRLLVRDLGVSEYLTKPVTRDAVLRLLLPHLGGAPRRGRTIRAAAISSPSAAHAAASGRAASRSTWRMRS